MERPAIFARIHAIVANGKRVTVEDVTPFVELRVGNEIADVVISLDRAASEHLFRTLEAKLFLSDKLPDHFVEAYAPGAPI